jgi:hypothetical protein
MWFYSELCFLVCVRRNGPVTNVNELAPLTQIEYFNPSKPSGNYMCHLL